MTTAEHAAGPLDGIRILDLSRVIMGPYATQILADQGAEVIVIEPPEGDMNRVLGGGPRDDFSGISLNLMRNKRSIALDLKSADGHARALELAATCDAVVSTMRPPVLRRLGLAYEDVRDVNPSAIYCQGQGWPLDSPRGDEPAYDDIVQAASGFADLGPRMGGSRELLPTIIADKVCGIFMAQAITAGLIHRIRTGEGQHIEVPMVSAMQSFMLVEHGAGAISEPPVAPPGYRRVLTTERRPCATKDGWVHVLPYAPKHFEALFIAIGAPERSRDERFADRRAAIVHSESLYRDVREIMATMTTDEAVSLCQGLGIPVTRVATLDEMVAELPLADHPEAGRYHVLPHAVRFSRTPAGLRTHAPGIGADSHDVLPAVSPDASVLTPGTAPTPTATSVANAS